MRSSELPLISVVIPVRNEVRHIEACLASILAGSYPADRMEILVVDGQSEDGTREVVLGLSTTHPFIRLLDNPARVVPHAMNIGIRAAVGEMIVRLDAHAKYGREYLMQLIDWMQRLKADNVGGVVVTQPAGDSAQARAVALVLSHPFGVGNSAFRLAAGVSPIEVDTVPFGCYHREVFERIGLYDEMFIRNQDDELNARLKMAGGRIFLVPDIRVEYVARASLRQFARMLFQYGYFKPLIALKLGRPATLRQLAPPVFTALLLGLPIAFWALPHLSVLWAVILAIHTTTNICASMALARRHGRSLLPYLISGFLLGHLAYGTGYLKGIVDFGLLRRHLRRSGHDISLSR